MIILIIAVTITVTDPHFNNFSNLIGSHVVTNGKGEGVQGDK